MHSANLIGFEFQKLFKKGYILTFVLLLVAAEATCGVRLFFDRKADALYDAATMERLCRIYYEDEQSILDYHELLLEAQKKADDLYFEAISQGNYDYEPPMPPNIYSPNKTSDLRYIEKLLSLVESIRRRRFENPCR